MASVFRSFMDRFFRSEGRTIIIAGLGNSGKTTFLYLLKTGEVVQTIPSIGFNVENVSAATANGRVVKFTGWDVGAGCADSGRLSMMINMYTPAADAVIWMVDSAEERGWLEESVDTLKRVIDGLESHRLEAGTSTMREQPILVLANKQDLPGAASIDDIRKAFSKVLQRHTASIFKVSMTQSAQTGIPDALEWLYFALENAPTKRLERLAFPDPVADSRSSSSLVEKLDSWLTRAGTDSSPEDFVDHFNTLNLPSWDHYTHIRIAFVLLTLHGRQKGKNMIFDGIERYIKESSQTRGRTFHITMTYFWIQIVHLGIQSISSPTLAPSSVGASSDEFGRFLLRNPYVADGNLWTDYYSKDIMMSPAAKAGMVLPDKKPLPNLVVRDAI